jgi:carbonic anhydrase/acetyltransferase-like protein (isoleucine patch superfamily)
MRPSTSRIHRFLRQSPVLGRGVYIAQGAVVLGDVRLGDFSSVWYHAVLRGDLNRIVVGHHSNIQDHAVLHLSDDHPCQVGNYVTVGHGAMVHACVVGHEVLIGMGATILDGAIIGDQCLVGARALVTPNTRIPPGSLVLGAPARVARALKPAERRQLKSWAEAYVANAAYCRAHGIGVGQPLAAPQAPRRTRRAGPAPGR